MIDLSLEVQEAEVLNEVLQSYLSNLSYEIANTDLKDYREQLKDKRAVLEKIKSALDA